MMSFYLCEFFLFKQKTSYLLRISDWSSDVCSSDLKPVGQGDDVPTAPVTVAVALADKLDTLISFFAVREQPSGSRDPFALRRAALGILATRSEERRVGQECVSTCRSRC